jgi:drug/metabolite transporter (DMT)-like permease
MQQQMQSYFGAEKGESGFFIGLGVLALVLGAVFFTRDSAALRGAAFPLVLVGLIQLGVGLGVYLRTDKQQADLISLMRSDRPRFLAEELPRMDKVNRNFDVYKIVEIVLLVVGVGLVVYGRGGRPMLLGVGAGLAAQSAIMLALDFFAEARADRYTEMLRALGGG